MILREHTQSLAEFRASPDATFDRLDRTGGAEVITVNGEARAVLISPEAYGELTLAAMARIDRAMVEQSWADVQAGRTQSAKEAIDEIASEFGLAIERRPAAERQS